VLTLLLLLPLAGAVAVMLLPKDRPDAIRGLSLAVGIAGLVLGIPLWTGFEPGGDQFQFLQDRDWIPQVGVAWRVGIDGISLLLIELTLLLLPLVVMFSWKSVGARVKEFHACLLVLQVGMLGVFMSLDLFLFFVFWEVMLVPMYLLIGAWGGPNRLYAALKFFLYTAFGSAFMLVGILKLWTLNGGSFDLRAMTGLQIAESTQWWIFLAFFLGFAVKVPMFPFHTWLPDAHGEAPTAGSVVLAGVMLKMGTFGFVRLALPILPEAAVRWMPFLLTLCVVGIVYGALTAMAQKDMKYLVAYSSVSHLGFVMMGIFCLNPTGLSGGLVQMINHGLSTGALFLVVGMIYDRRHTKQIADLGGLAKSMPLWATLLVIASMASIAVPGLNGFVGEFAILLGAIELVLDDWRWMVLVALAATAIVLGAAYMLWMVKRVAFGPVTNPDNRDVPDVKVGSLEFWSVAPLLALCVVLGLYPKPLFDVLEAPVRRIVVATRPGYYEHASAESVLPVVALPVERTGGDADHGHGGGDGH
jgi:NADH-quinone oxidoreductase subunit M